MVGRMSVHDNNPSMNDLRNRLASFDLWPNTGAVKPKDLAEAGFYYVGIGDDTVCCFSCGVTINRWQIGDIPEERHRRLSGNHCEFLQRHAMDSLDSSMWSGMNLNLADPNIRVRPGPTFDPIDNDMENEEQRLRSFQRNNGWKGQVDPRKLAAAGFYYTGIHDHVKCFACDVSLKAWLPGDNPIKEHLKIQPNCSYISRFGNKFSVTFGPSVSLQETGSTPPNVGQTLRSTSYDPSPSYQPHVLALGARLPGSKPNYASEHARLHTFINWPKNCPVQPKELIDAGFYYTGNGDKVECFKCGIILAGWEPQDTPWGEHEKWSKDCPLVIEHLRRRNPHSPSQGPRPKEQTWTTPPAAVGPPAVEMEEETKVVQLPPKEDKQEGKQSTKTVQNARTTESSSDEIFYLERGVQRLLEGGQYDYSMLKEAVQQRTKIEMQPINNMEELLNAVQSYQALSNQKSTAVNNSPVVFNNPSSQAGGVVSFDPDALQRQVEKLEDAHRCKVCLDAEIGIVFLPCGHLVCCPKCAQELQAKRDCLCPICRRHIDSTIRSYLT